MHYNFTVIEGNIGSGKTSLVKKLAEEFKADTILEEFEDNPFLSEFLESQTKNNLAVELQFLMDRFHQLNRSTKNTKLIGDYFIEKSLIFSSANLTATEKSLFDSYFNVLFDKIRKPDLLIYLNVNTERLLKNINKRGREYEQTIDHQYLTKVHQSYLDYFNEVKDQRILIIDTSAIDFVSDESHYADLKEIISRDYEVGVHKIQLQVEA